MVTVSRVPSAVTKVYKGIAVLAAVLAAAGAALAAGGKEQIKLNAHDNASARAAVVKSADLGSGWTGGLVKPDLSPPPTCPGYNPKQSDLVLTGVAESHFMRTGLDIQSETQVLKTAQMVSLDWHRSVDTAGLVPCLRTHLGKSLGAAAKVISFAKTSFPQVATYAAAFRALVDVTAAGKTVHVLVDIVPFGRGRTELTLTVTAPASAASAVTAGEIRLARLLVARAKA
jgi:hypothetical protein